MQTFISFHTCQPLQNSKRYKKQQLLYGANNITLRDTNTIFRSNNEIMLTFLVYHPHVAINWGDLKLANSNLYLYMFFNFHSFNSSYFLLADSDWHLFFGLSSSANRSHVNTFQFGPMFQNLVDNKIKYFLNVLHCDQNELNTRAFYRFVYFLCLFQGRNQRSMQSRSNSIVFEEFQCWFNNKHKIVIFPQTKKTLFCCCCCCSAYLFSCHRTASDANLLDDPHTFHYQDYFLIGGIRTCLGGYDDPMFLWISSNSCPLNLLLV